MPIYENDGKVRPEAGRVGCYCLSIAHFHPDIDDGTFNAAWDSAIDRGYIDSDENLVNPQGFVDILGYMLKLRVDERGRSHYPLDTPIDPERVHLVAEWHNKNTGFTHFVVMDGKGITKDHVSYDPIQGGSRTVREGYPVSYRIFDKA